MKRNISGIFIFEDKEPTCFEECREETQDKWLENLDIQTLTDDLKSEIIEKVTYQVETLNMNAYDEGYNEARDEIMNYITNNI